MAEGRLCERGAYERVTCERVACEKVVCEQVVCEKVCVCVSCVEMVEDRLCERGKYERVVCERVVCEFCVWHVWLKTVAPSATPAAQNGGRCFQMPRLPHKRTAVAPTGTKCATRASPVP